MRNAVHFLLLLTIPGLFGIVMLTNGCTPNESAAPGARPCDAIGIGAGYAMSPDNVHIVFAQPVADGAGRIFDINKDSTGRRQLTNGPGSDRMPVYSSDGSRIAFARCEPQTGEQVWIMDADGKNQRALTSVPDKKFPNQFSADDAFVYFTLSEPSDNGNAVFQRFWRVEILTGKSEMVNTPENGVASTVSADGKRILGSSREIVGDKVTSRIYETAPHAKGRTYLADGGFPCFSRDGQSIVAGPAEIGGVRTQMIRTMKADGSAVRDLAPPADIIGEGVYFCEDGRSVLVFHPSTAAQPRACLYVVRLKDGTATLVDAFR